MAENKLLRIIDFTEYPGPRYIKQKGDSGEKYYIEVLNKAFYECLCSKMILEVDLDGTAGYPSSFLDEAFGELVYDFSLDNVKKYLRIKTKFYLNRKEKVINETFPEWEKRRRMNDTVVNTVEHPTELYHLTLDGKWTTRKIGKNGFI